MSAPATLKYHGNDKLVWHRACGCYLLAICTDYTERGTATRGDLQIAEGVSNIAVSITALFSGILIVVAGRTLRSTGPRTLDQYWSRPEHLRLVADRSLARPNCDVLDSWAHYSGHFCSMHHASDTRFKAPRTMTILSPDRSAVQRDGDFV
jgi:hypothetical protein